MTPDFFAYFGAILLAAGIAWVVTHELARDPALHVRALQRLFPQRCGNGHWWDPAVCFRLHEAPRVELVTVDHNGEIFEMWCGDEHAKPAGKWTSIRLDPPIVNGTWRDVEKAVKAQMVGAR